MDRYRLFRPISGERRRAFRSSVLRRHEIGRMEPSERIERFVAETRRSADSRSVRRGRSRSEGDTGPWSAGVRPRLAHHQTTTTPRRNSRLTSTTVRGSGRSPRDQRTHGSAPKPVARLGLRAAATSPPRCGRAGSRRRSYRSTAVVRRGGRRTCAAHESRFRRLERCRGRKPNSGALRSADTCGRDEPHFAIPKWQSGTNCPPRRDELVVDEWRGSSTRACDPIVPARTRVRASKSPVVDAENGDGETARGTPCRSTPQGHGMSPGTRESVRSSGIDRWNRVSYREMEFA